MRARAHLLDEREHRCGSLWRRRAVERAPRPRIEKTIAEVEREEAGRAELATAEQQARRDAQDVEPPRSDDGVVEVVQVERDDALLLRAVARRCGLAAPRDRADTRRCSRGACRRRSILRLRGRRRDPAAPASISKKSGAAPRRYASGDVLMRCILRTKRSGKRFVRSRSSVSCRSASASGSRSSSMSVMAPGVAVFATSFLVRSRRALCTVPVVLVPAVRSHVARCLEEGILSGSWSRALARAHAPFAHDRSRAPLRLPRYRDVVTVGGATLGGSGKTRVALACARELARAGARVVLVGHAYRATAAPRARRLARRLARRRRRRGARLRARSPRRRPRDRGRRARSSSARPGRPPSISRVLSPRVGRHRRSTARCSSRRSARRSRSSRSTPMRPWGAGERAAGRRPPRAARSAPRAADHVVAVDATPRAATVGGRLDRHRVAGRGASWRAHRPLHGHRPSGSPRARARARRARARRSSFAPPITARVDARRSRGSLAAARTRSVARHRQVRASTSSGLGIGRPELAILDGSMPLPRAIVRSLHELAPDVGACAYMRGLTLRLLKPVASSRGRFAAKRSFVLAFRDEPRERAGREDTRNDDRPEACRRDRRGRQAA